MLASKLFPLLARPEVQEIVLLSGKPPCALVNGTYRRLSSQTLRDEDILSVIVAARGQEQLGNLGTGAQWQVQMASVGMIIVVAGYEGTLLRATLRIAQSRSVRDMPAQRASNDLQAAPALHPGPPAPATARGPKPDLAAAFAFGEDPDVPGLELEQPIATAARAPAQGHAPAQAAHAYAQAPAQAHAPPVQAQAYGHAPPVQAQAYGHAPPPAAAPAAQPRARPAPVMRGGDLLDTMLGRARELAASDLHILADRPPMLRIAGDLVAQPETPSADEVERVLLPRVPATQLPILDSTGSCDFSLIHPHYGRFRVNVSRQRSGYKLTARPIGQHIPTLAQLGLPETIAGALHHHQGLIVITGPTGHGKTTTLAALVGILNRETTHHVITVEDPIEYVHDTASAVISQREVGSHTKTFAAALKGSLREDPDVIVVGELRDTETVRMALSASETGHLVISTMNTPSAAKAIERLIDLFPPGDQPQVRMTLAGGLRLIISQRLLPTADRKQLCVAAEVLPGITPLWNLIRENRTYQIASLQQRGKGLGITRLDDSLAELVKSGRTTMEIAREYADSAELLEALVSGKSLVQRGAAAQPQPDAGDDNQLSKKGVELGKQVMSRAGKLFGGDSK